MGRPFLNHATKVKSEESRNEIIAHNQQTKTTGSCHSSEAVQTPRAKKFPWPLSQLWQATDRPFRWRALTDDHKHRGLLAASIISSCGERCPPGPTTCEGPNSLWQGRRIHWEVDPAFVRLLHTSSSGEWATAVHCEGKGGWPSSRLVTTPR